MVMFMSPLDAPRRGWDLWRFASLIPSGCRLPPIHKVMGDHASRGPTPARGFSATWSLLMDISMIFDSPCAIKRFLRTSWWKMNSVCAKNVLMFTPTRELHSKSPDGDGGWSRHWLPKRGDPRSGEDRRNSPSPPWLLLSRAQFLNKSVSCELTN